MKDFTKDELSSLAYCMRQMTIHIDGYDILYDKIQSLIDNYCEHSQGLIPDGYKLDICKRCKEPM